MTKRIKCIVYDYSMSGKKYPLRLISIVNFKEHVKISIKLIYIMEMNFQPIKTKLDSLKSKS